MSKEGSNHVGADDLLGRGQESKLKDALSLARSSVAPRLNQKTAAEQFAEKHDSKAIYDFQSKRYFLYEYEQKGVWTSVDDEVIRMRLRTEADAKGLTYTARNLVDTANLIKSDSKIARRWEPLEPRYLPFLNGMLDREDTAEDKRLRPHDPCFHAVWVIPRDYNPTATDWSIIQKFFDVVTKRDKTLFDVLICYFAAILRGWTDIHKFLHLAGAGGTGKSTLMRLATAMIGKEATCTTTLQELQSRFGTHKLQGKALVLMPDHDRSGQELLTFKGLTGGDHIRAEVKNGASYEFVPSAMVIMCSNHPIFMGATDSGIQRRVLLVPMDHKEPAWEGRDILSPMVEQLDAFINHLLALDSAEAHQRLREGTMDSAAAREKHQEYLRRSDNVAAWAGDCLTSSLENTFVRVGNDKGNSGNLYGNYYQYSQRTGSLPVSLKDFSPRLETNLKAFGITARKGNLSDTRQSVFYGVTLKKDWEPSLSDLSESCGYEGMNSKSEGVPEGIETRTVNQREAIEGIILTSLLGGKKEGEEGDLCRAKLWGFTPSTPSRPLPETNSSLQAPLRSSLRESKAENPLFNSNPDEEDSNLVDVENKSIQLGDESDDDDFSDV